MCYACECVVFIPVSCEARFLIFLRAPNNRQQQHQHQQRELRLERGWDADSPSTTDRRSQLKGPKLHSSPHTLMSNLYAHFIASVFCFWEWCDVCVWLCGQCGLQCNRRLRECSYPSTQCASSSLGNYNNTEFTCSRSWLRMSLRLRHGLQSISTITKRPRGRPLHWHGWNPLPPNFLFDCVLSLWSEFLKSEFNWY